MIAGVVLGTCVEVRAQLTSKSPFMAPEGATSNSPTAGAPLQFAGYMETSEGRLYRVYDPAKKAGSWVKLNQKNNELGVTAKQHDEKHNTLTIELDGKTITLAAREPKVVSSGSAAAAVPPPVVQPAPSNVPPAVTQAVVLNPSPADEQRRLDVVAAEVARRRALRAQAEQNITQGAAPAVALPQGVPQPPPPGPQRPNRAGLNNQSR